MRLDILQMNRNLRRPEITVLLTQTGLSPLQVEGNLVWARLPEMIFQVSNLFSQ